jgi:hypothetical protein
MTTHAARLALTPQGIAQVAVAALLGAAGVAVMVVQPDLWSENPDYSARVSLGRNGWMLACYLAAAAVTPGWRGLVSTWIGALVALPVLVPIALSASPTMGQDPFWTNLSILSSAVWALVLLGLAFGAGWAIGRMMPSRGVRLTLVAAAAVVCAVSIGLVVAPAGRYTGPQPAPTYPGAQPAPTYPG